MRRSLGLNRSVPSLQASAGGSSPETTSPRAQRMQPHKFTVTRSKNTAPIPSPAAQDEGVEEEAEEVGRTTPEERRRHFIEESRQYEQQQKSARKGPRTASPADYLYDTPEAIEIQIELEQIKLRRRELELQRQRLQERAKRMLTKEEGRVSRLDSSRGDIIGSGSSRKPRSHSAHRPAHADVTAPTPGAFMSPIYADEDEIYGAQRNRSTTQAAMKRAMKASWRQDSSLVGGYFLQEDNVPHTFGTERRFRDPIGMKQRYYLGDDMTTLQKTKSTRSLSCRSRGAVGCNVSTHWNDPAGGGAPGPGAYTPRYQKLSVPIKRR